MVSLKKFKSLIEGSPVAFATVTAGGKPNVIGVAFAKVVGDATVVVTDNYMVRTLEDLAANPAVCLAVWGADLKGVKLVGRAAYHAAGKWKKFVEGLPENIELPAKGAVVVRVSKTVASR